MNPTRILLGTKTKHENYGLNMNAFSGYDSDLDIHANSNSLTFNVSNEASSFDFEIIYDEENFTPSYQPSNEIISLVQKNYDK